MVLPTQVKDSQKRLVVGLVARLCGGAAGSWYSHAKRVKGAPALTLPTILQVTDEPVGSLLRALTLEDQGGDQFDAHSLPQVRRVYGGQVVAQGLLAAAATVDPARLPHSLHAYFLRGGNPDETFSLTVDRIRDGRSFSNRRVTASQQMKEILTMDASFQGPEGSFACFTYSAPQVSGPEDLDSALDLFRAIDHPVAKFLGKTAAFDVRHVQHSLYTTPDPTRPANQQLWMRIRTPIPEETPQVVQRALLAYVIDQVMLEPAMRSVGLSWLTEGLSLASLDHAMWFHRDVDINDWLLYDGRATFVGGGRAVSNTLVFDSEGAAIATATQEGMVRVANREQEETSSWAIS